MYRPIPPSPDYHWRGSELLLLRSLVLVWEGWAEAEAPRLPSPSDLRKQRALAGQLGHPTCVSRNSWLPGDLTFHLLGPLGRWVEEPIFQMRKLRQCLVPLAWLGSWQAWGSAHPHGHWVPCPQCSTTCGLGAVWRLVRCSSGREEDCAPAGRPQPARRCHLRPCAAWHMGNWSKVCEGGGWQSQGMGHSPRAHGLCLGSATATTDQWARVRVHSFAL